jgi:hypothetical protein
MIHILRSPAWNMTDLAATRKRFLRDDIPTRLGGLAANLARVGSFSKNVANREAVFSLLDESKWFIEWTAAETAIETAAQLVELQIELALWQLDWTAIWPNVALRAAIATHSRMWSERVLQLSGLVD